MIEEYNIIADFYKDWTNILRDELVHYGFTVDPNEDPENISLRFFNYKKRIIEPNPRNILESNVFSCPAEMIPGLELVKEKIKNGDDLKPHLSKRLTDLDYNDPLLNDWGIYHIHLGTSIETNGFVNRTGPLLYARFDNDNAYLINVLSHGAWTKQEFIKIVYENWPETIERYRLKGIVGLDQQISDDELKILRKGNVTTMIELGKNLVFAPPGGGYQTSGLSTEVLMTSDRFNYRITDIEKNLRNEIKSIAAKFQEKGVILPKVLNFSLQIRNNEILAFENNIGIVVKYGSLEF